MGDFFFRNSGFCVKYLLKFLALQALRDNASST